MKTPKTPTPPQSGETPLAAGDTPDLIRIRGAAEHNLKHIDCDIPRNELVVLTGISGSGKSSLAFDTIYAEGQRRYMESLSSYARQFLGQMEKPDVEKIEGLSPAISIDQKSTNRNPRSTVGTVTEVYDYFRLLYARIGIPHCPDCGREIRRQTIDQIVDQVMELVEGTRIQLLAPIVRGRKGEHAKVLERARRSGYVRAQIDGSLYELSEDIKLDKNIKHNIDIVVDRLVVRDGIEKRLADSVENVMELAGGLLTVDVAGAAKPAGHDPVDENAPGPAADDAPAHVLNFSTSFACPDCGVSLSEIEPRNFSFNNPFGACPVCAGLGYKMEFALELMIPDRRLSIKDGAFAPPGWASSTDPGSFTHAILQALAEAYHFSLDTPFGELSAEVQEILIHGTGGREVEVHYQGQRGRGVYPIAFEGLVRNMERRYRETSSEGMKAEYESFMSITPCHECQGMRLKKESLAVTVAGRNIFEITSMPINVLYEFMAGIAPVTPHPPAVTPQIPPTVTPQCSGNSGEEHPEFLAGPPECSPDTLTPQQRLIGRRILREIHARLGFLCDVGLNYLTLARATSSLSGGEAQRIRLATQIGSGLVGVCYILDEPSIGLHQRDNAKLLKTLMSLRDLGNTLIVVEHDEETMLAADHIIDIGPGAGINGGEVVATGTATEIMATPASITGQYLSGQKAIAIPASRRQPTGHLHVKGAAANNLKNIDVEIPLGVFTCVTGVSGSGKSSLVSEILYKRLAKELNRARTIAGKHAAIIGIEQLDKVIDIDQSPIGRTPRSNPATYTGVFDHIRDLFAATPDAKMKGYKKGRFSFNVKGGRCEACAGDGIIKIEMHFLPDVYVPCEVCKGQRYNRETLDVRYKGKNIYDILDMTVEEAHTFFENVPQIKRKISTLHDVGLSYIKLGQPATTLSGGEAQRVKLATELSRRSTGKTIYILDEPTTGLHFFDVHKLVDILQQLTEGGNTVVVIEHNLDVIKCADHIIDMGPEGGDGGGCVIAQGTPEQVAATAGSWTGVYVGQVLE